MQIDHLSYGSDQSGLICAYIFERDQPGQLIYTKDALQWLTEHQHGVRGLDSFIWLHFNLSNVSAEKWLREHADLPEEFYETLHEGSGSTRIEHAENSLIAVVNDVLHDFALRRLTLRPCG